jgi:polyisoprenoid-binding protein YceI
VPVSKPSLHSTQRHWRCARLLLALPVLLTACQTPAPRTLDRTTPEAVAAPSDEVLRAEYASLARHGGQTYVIDAARSQLLIYAYRGGTMARLGHNHVLRATQINGYVHVPASAAATAARFDLRVPLAQLLIDEPELRAATGDAFAGQRSAADIAGTQHNMLGPDNLDAARFPDVRVHASAISGDWPALVADIEITLHGVTRAMTVPLLVHREQAELTVTGALALRQSDFGITPYSVTIRFELIAR